MATAIDRSFLEAEFATVTDLLGRIPQDSAWGRKSLESRLDALRAQLFSLEAQSTDPAPVVSAAQAGRPAAAGDSRKTHKEQDDSSTTQSGR